MKQLTNMLMASGLMVLALCQTAHAQLSPGQEVLKRASEYGAAQPIFLIEYDLELNISTAKQPMTITVGYTVAYQRPDLVAIMVDDESIDLATYSDGKKTIQHIEQFNQYMERDAYAEPAELFGSMANPQFKPALDFLGEYARKSPFASLLNEGVEVKLIGNETINDVDCDHLQLTYGGQKMDAWFSEGDKPLLQRVNPDMTKMTEMMKEREKSDDVSVVLKLDKKSWKQDQDIAKLALFTPGADDEKVDNFYQPSPTHQLRGKPAPAVSLSDINGDSFALADKKGKEVVVLDFWATWCGPCRVGMPILNKVVNEFKDKDVRLYTVNASDSPDQIKKFLDSNKLDVAVLMDTERKASTAYSASSIPTTIIIDKEGVVRKVHVGINQATYEATLRAELTELTQ